MTHGRSPSRPGSLAGGGQAGPGARQRRSLTGAGARAGGGAERNNRLAVDADMHQALRIIIEHRLDKLHMFI
jgi:hypothetical protein